MENNYSDKKSIGVEKQPEFAQLLDAFREELFLLGDNSINIYNRVNTIKDMSEPRKEASPEQLPSGILSELWACIGTLREHNKTLNQAKNGLINLIG